MRKVKRGWVIEAGHRLPRPFLKDLPADCFPQLRHRRNPAVQRSDRSHIQLQALDILEKVQRGWIRGRGRSGIRSQRGEQVDLRQDLLLRKIRHQNALIVWTALNVVNLQGMGAVGQSVPRRHRHDLRFLFLTRKAVGVQCMRQLGNPFVERLIDLMSDDRRALRDVSAQPAGMIEVMVRADHVLDRFAGNQLLGLGDHRQGTFFVQGGLGPCPR